MTLAESQLALAALAGLCAGERDAVAILRRRVRPIRIRAGCRSLRVVVRGEQAVIQAGGVDRV